MNSMKASKDRTRTHVGKKYEMGKTLGHGSFAKVKFARNVETGQSFAIKILDRHLLLRHKMVNQIKKEISTMKMIKHPNVIKIFEVMASNTKIYIVLEFVDGGELFDIISRHGKLREDEARKYFQQLINAVDYCHSRGVYHRDLKPENLLLDSSGSIKVSDFGLSTFSQQVIKDKGYNGTPADVWSCGVILYVLMAGYLPFSESNLQSLYRKISRAEFQCPPWFSSGARKLLGRILDPNPLTRIKISEILGDEWFIKGYKRAVFEEEKDVNLDDVDLAFNDSKENLVKERKEKPVSMNAFELISRSDSFKLDNLFEKQKGIVKRETSFTSQCPANDIISKIEETAKPLGFNVHKRDYKMKLKGDKDGRKGQLSVATEVLNLTNPYSLVFISANDDNRMKSSSILAVIGLLSVDSTVNDVFEVAPCLHLVELRKTGADTLEFHKFYKNFSTGLQDMEIEEESEQSRS